MSSYQHHPSKTMYFFTILMALICLQLVVKASDGM